MLEDNKYLSSDEAGAEVREVLKSLELDRHRLRIQLAMNGMDGEAKLQNNMTINEAIKLANSRIANMEEVFADVLDEDEDDS